MKILFKIMYGHIHVDNIMKEVESLKDVFKLTKNIVDNLPSYDENDEDNFDEFYDEDVQIMLDTKYHIAHMEQCCSTYANSKMMEEMGEKPIIPHLGRVHFDELEELCNIIEKFKDEDFFYTKSDLIVDFSY